MKRKPEPSKKYQKELLTLMRQKRVKRDELEKIIDDICNGIPLDKKYSDHQLSENSPKKYQGCRDFHYKSNICVIYKIHDDKVELVRIGSHQDLELTESVEAFPRGYFDKYKISDEYLEEIRNRS